MYELTFGIVKNNDMWIVKSFEPSDKGTRKGYRLGAYLKGFRAETLREAVDMRNDLLTRIGIDPPEASVDASEEDLIADRSKHRGIRSAK